jgi:hypothetical protein
MSLEDEIKAECRLYAIEWAVSLLFAATFAQIGPGAEAKLEEARKYISEIAQQKTFPRLDPAMSDLASAEREAAVDRLLSYAKDALAYMQQADKG